MCSFSAGHSTAKLAMNGNGANKQSEPVPSKRGRWEGSRSFASMLDFQHERSQSAEGSACQEKREEWWGSLSFFSLVLAGVTWWYHVCIGTTPLAWRYPKGMVRHGMVFHSVNSETNPCRTMPWARFRLDSPLGTLASNECSAELTSEFHR